METTAKEQCPTKWEAALGPRDPAGTSTSRSSRTDESRGGGDDCEVTCFMVAADGTPFRGSKLLARTVV